MDHVLQLNDMLESFREMNGDLQDINTNTLSNRMNEIMKVLTMFSALFIPLSFLAAVYGMNFDILPELHWTQGYYYFWGICALTASGMLVYFIRKKWL
jgi:magnesium transporter